MRDYNRQPLGKAMEPMQVEVEEPKPEPPPVEIERAELERLRQRSIVLNNVLTLARTAFTRGDLARVEDLPSIALAAKILNAGGQPL